MTQYKHVRATQLIGIVPSLMTKYKTQLKTKVGIKPGCKNHKIQNTAKNKSGYKTRL